MRLNKDASATYAPSSGKFDKIWLAAECPPLPHCKGRSVTVSTAGGRTKLEKLEERIGESKDGKWELWRIKPDE